MKEVKERRGYTLAQIQEKLGVEQHRLIHLCEKRVITPDYEDASGRGSMRRFSQRNLFEFALALELRRFLLPVVFLVPIIRVLESFERYASEKIKMFHLPRSLQSKPAVGLKIVISEGRYLYFVMKYKGEQTYLGGLDLRGRPERGFNHIQKASQDPTHSSISRFEIDLNKIAENLQKK